MGEIQGAGAGSETRDDPRWIRVRVSRINLALTATGALLAVPMLFFVPMPPLVRALLLALFLVAMAIDLVLALLILPTAVVSFQLVDSPPVAHAAATGVSPVLGIRICRRGRTGAPDLKELDGTVPAGSFVTPWLTALRYHLPDDPAWRRVWPRVIPLWPDSIPADDFRRTRVALKWK